MILTATCVPLDRCFAFRTSADAPLKTKLAANWLTDRGSCWS